MARTINIVLGGWLFISTFVWPHARGAYHTTWIIGIFIVLFALLAMRAPILRYANTVLGLLLLLSALGYRHLQTGTAWHNGIIGLVIIVVSLVLPHDQQLWHPEQSNRATAGPGRPRPQPV